MFVVVRGGDLGRSTAVSEVWGVIPWAGETRRMGRVLVLT